MIMYFNLDMTIPCGWSISDQRLPDEAIHRERRRLSHAARRSSEPSDAIVARLTPLNETG
jgi:hypothetical protein